MNQISILKSQLQSLYRNLLERAGTLPSPLVEQLGCPFLLFPGEGWPERKHRLLVVGQEPFDWRFENGKWGFENGNPPVSWPHDPLWSLEHVLDYGRRCGLDRAVEALPRAM
jgi:hypothetical protein